MWSFEQNTNHKSSPQSRNHHGDVQKNVIPNTLGVTRSIAYRQNRLVNKKTAIIIKMILHLGIKKVLVVGTIKFSCNCLRSIFFRQRILWYFTVHLFVLPFYFYREFNHFSDHVFD
jgi:hypothetical protein